MPNATENEAAAPVILYGAAKPWNKIAPKPYPKPTPKPAGAIIAILRDPARRGGFRCAKVAELDRLTSLAGSRVIETRNPTRQHYVSFSHLARTAATACLKLRALRAANFAAE